MIGWRAGLIWLLLAGGANALELSLPAAARQTVARDTGPDSYLAPVSAYEDGGFASVKIEGAIARSAWRLEAPGLTPLQIMRPLRTQLENADYRIVLDCSATVCGGFDFRFAIETLPAPNMYVDLRQYQFVTAVKGSLQAPDAVVTLLISTTDTSAYLQIVQADTQAGAASPVASVVAQDTQPAAPAAPDAPAQSPSKMASALEEFGHVVLAALDFDTGTAALGQGEFDALVNLAAVLKDQPDLRIALVGHTDSVGGLQGNITLSKNRAAAVRQRLIAVHGIAADRIDAQGMGYLSPIASNQTEAGRDANRRVEAVLLPAS
ncbi:hypothetical protein LCGC14_0229500 [marine sediment metagenome]|uniref:OmpA family protein n=2 Tax=root TaxID=1 RepID=A0A1H0HJ88_9RHOB|nr:OmpA family protein [Sulfitobacter litoralis]MBQ0716473.1 OmpA family protein [Sulfitobacter litoralis]SDO19248.1 OmpA-OmpF porin, OOP family [Sulfitobacter litoralis]HDY95838.1 OmpA family protein [Sulfitobacter litoralis]HDZ51119.1 OmpA family protein [Sulfitobacter litoralis]